METKVESKMFHKTCSKHNIRRAVLGTCVVLAADGGASGGGQPRKVTITLSRRRGCWRALSSRKVAAFAFSEASGPTFVTAPLDLEYLFRCSGKQDAAATQIKICVAYRRGATRKARVSLEEFLEVLLHGGRPGSFYLYIYEDKVGLQQASQQFQALPTTWPLEQKPDKGKKAMYTEGNTDATYNEWKVFLEQVFSMKDDEGDTDNDEDTYNEWKVYLEKVFAVEDHEANTDKDDDLYNDDDTYNERKNLPERVFTVKDDDFDEAPHEAGEASNVDATEEEEASNVPAAEEEEASDVDTPEEEEASDVPAAEEEEATDVGAAEEEEASDVPAAEEEEASDVPAAEEEEASDVGAAEEEEASDVPAAEEEEASDVPAAEEEEASDVAAADGEEATGVGSTRGEEASDAGAAEEEAPLHGEASRGEVLSPVTVTAAPATASLAYRSLTVAQRFIARLAGPSDRQLEDLRRSHGVSIVRVRRTLHIKGDRDAVLRCHRHIRDEIAEWRRSEAAEAQ